MAIEFDGDNYFIVNGWPVPSATDGIISVSYWIKPTNLSSGTQRHWGSEGDMEVRTDSSGNLFGDIFTGTTLEGTTTLVNDTWYHIVITGDTNTDEAELYLNGVLEDSHSNAVGTEVGTTLSIGTRETSSQGFEGIMDDWRSYDRVLSANEVQTIYATRGTDGIVDSLTARFLFDEKEEGATVTAPVDVSPNLLGITSVVSSPVYQGSRLKFTKRVA